LNPKQACLKRREEEKSENHFNNSTGSSTPGTGLGLPRLSNSTSLGSATVTGTGMGFGTTSHPTTSIGSINSATGALGSSFTPNVNYELRVPVIPPSNVYGDSMPPSGQTQGHRPDLDHQSGSLLMSLTDSVPGELCVPPSFNVSGSGLTDESYGTGSSAHVPHLAQAAHHHHHHHHHTSHLQSLNFPSTGSSASVTADATGWYGSGCSPQSIVPTNTMDPTDSGRNSAQHAYSDLPIGCESQTARRATMIPDDDAEGDDEDGDGDYDGDDLNADELESCSPAGDDEDEDDDDAILGGPSKRGSTNRTVTSTTA
uniref:Fruitless n=1 Tax=Echinostoma caproni TaxID=27848 RepID=A0A183B3S3_9TREM